MVSRRREAQRRVSPAEGESSKGPLQKLPHRPQWQVMNSFISSCSLITRPAVTQPQRAEVSHPRWQWRAVTQRGALHYHQTFSIHALTLEFRVSEQPG